MICTSGAAFATQYNFDYVIIGGGTAGLVVAARLAEDPSIMVGVIEAGEYVTDEPAINIPGYFGRTLGNPRYDWAYLTTPQAGANNRQIFHPRGKILGGSSAVNFMILGRASKKEYDAFEMIGNKGWNHEEIEKYIRKSETSHAAPADVASTYNANYSAPHHGTSGPIQKRHASWFSGLHLPFFEALKSVGINACPDSSNGDNTGSQSVTLSIDPATATRSYATNAYFEPRAHSTNLIVLCGAQVSRVIFTRTPSSSAVTATGVEYVKDGQTFTVQNIKREVILSAGSLQTPQLLELSGIGQKSRLAEHGIESIVDLPGVGENLQDHAYVASCFEVDSSYETMDVVRDPELEPVQAELYKSGKGVYSNVHTAFAFIPLRSFVPAEDVEKMKKSLDEDKTFGKTGGDRKLHGLLKEWLDDPASAQLEIMQYPGFFPAPGTTPKPGARYQCLLAALTHTYSRGSVHITSSNPSKAPLIDPAYLTNQMDLDILVKGSQFFRRLAGEKGLKEVTRDEVSPGKNVQSEEEWREWVRNRVEPVYHPLGTAAMMPLEDGGVVDPTLKVYGTTNLRVVDASIIPFQISCHPTATIYGIAEKAADLIKEAQIQMPTPAKRSWLSAIWG